MICCFLIFDNAIILLSATVGWWAFQNSYLRTQTDLFTYTLKVQYGHNDEIFIEIFANMWFYTLYVSVELTGQANMRETKYNGRWCPTSTMIHEHPKTKILLMLFYQMVSVFYFMSRLSFRSAKLRKFFFLLKTFMY